MKFKKRSIGFLLTLLMIFTMSFSAFAGAQEDIKSAMDTAVKAQVANEDLVGIVISNGGSTSTDGIENPVPVVINGSTYYAPSAKADNIVSALEDRTEKKKSDDAEAKNTVTDVQNNLNVLSEVFKEADMGAAANMMSPLAGMISLLAGLLATLAILGMTLFTGCDVCYLAIPVLHGKMESKAAEGGNMSKQRSDGQGSKFRFVTDDAIVAYDNAQKEGKTPWGEYLKRRAIAFILIAIVIYILLTNNITLIINWALNLTSGIIEQINKFAAVTGK